MGESVPGAVAGVVAEQLLSKLLDKFFQEAVLVTGLKDDFEYLCREIRNIKCLLTDAGERRISSSVNNWLEKLQDVLYDAIDILDECEPQRFTNILSRYRMGRRIRNLKDRIAGIHKDAQYLKDLRVANDVSNGMQTLGTETSNTYAQKIRKRSSALLNETQTVGLNADIRKIIRLAVTEDSEARIIAIVAMGGMGKTLLLQHVYNSPDVKQHFDNLIWLSITQNYSIEKLQGVIGRKIKLHLEEKITEEEAANLIHERLRGKKSLFVLDDVWKEDASLLDLVGLPRENGCKIIISTRSTDVSKRMRANIIHNMEGLLEQDSWTLFCIHAFGDHQTDDALQAIESPVGQTEEINCASVIKSKCPPELEKIGREIEKKCARLPLAIITIAGSMSRKRRLRSEWESTLRRLNEVDISRDVSSTLRLSYDALPAYLKPCFLYCSVFPENENISSKYLIQLWIAEKLVSSREDWADVVAEAHCYLDDLIQRFLIQVSKVGGNGRVKICQMHDLLRDLAISISEEEYRCLLRAGKQFTDVPAALRNLGCRRISFMASGVDTIPDNNIGGASLRSLFISANKRLTRIDSSFLRSVKSLRVLDLRETSITSLSKSVGNLKHLVLLRLAYTELTELPESVRHLKKLEFLNLRGCKFLRKLPEGMGELKRLGYVDVTGCCKLAFLPRTISNLTSLDSLKGVIFTERHEQELKNAFMFDGLRNLTQLRSLKVTFEPFESEDFAWQCLGEDVFGGMVKMRSLNLQNCSYATPLALPEDMRMMSQLEKLRLKKFVVPEWICNFQNLLVIRLWRCECMHYPELETMPNLRELTINENRRCKELRKEFGKQGGFPNLDILRLIDLNHLTEVPALEEGAMPRLKSFSVIRCKRLKQMPKGFEHLCSLEKLEVWNCSGWKESLKESGEEYQKIKHHLPKVQIDLT